MESQIVNKEVFGQRFSEILATSSETTYTVAEQVSLSPATISRYANGLMAPKIPTLYMIADIFNVNPLWLMGYNAPKLKIVGNKDIVPNDSYKIKNPDIRMIARAGDKMTPEQAENLRKYAQYMFPEAIDDDNS